MNDILGAIRAGYKRRDTLLSIKEKLNKHYIIVQLTFLPCFAIIYK